MQLKIISIVFVFFLIANPLFLSNSYSSHHTYVAIVDTNSGRMLIEFFPEEAPKTVENFQKLAREGFYDGTKFHIVIEDYMIQGGDPNTKSDSLREKWGKGGPGYSIDAEFNSIEHRRGIVSMARANDPDSTGSQFFIVQKDSPSLDGGYTAFGTLFSQESFDTLDKIVNLQTDSNDLPLDLDAATINKIEIVKQVYLDKSNKKISVREAESDEFFEDITRRNPMVTIHIVLRDSDGNLVGYVEGHEWYRIRPGYFNGLMDDRKVTELIDYNGKIYEKFSFHYKKENIVRDYSYAGFIMWAPLQGGGRESALFMNHEAYQTKPGDTIEIYYTIIRPQA